MPITFQNCARSSIFYCLNLKNLPFKNCQISVLRNLSGRLPLYSLGYESQLNSVTGLFSRVRRLILGPQTVEIENLKKFPNSAAF